MKNLSLALHLTLFVLLSHAQNGLEGIIVEKFYISNENDTNVNSIGGVLPVGSVTYRIYVDMLPGYKLQAAYGVDQAPAGGTPSQGDHELRIETTTLFFNNEDRGATTSTFTKNRLSDNTVMLDSWLSVGAACDGHFGVMKTSDDGVATVVNNDGVLQSNDASAGIPLTQQDGIIAGNPESVTEVGISNEIAVFDAQNDGTNGPVFSTWNGSWACLMGCVGPDSMENKLLIAQITTDGVLTYELNIQIGTPSGEVENYVARNPVGNEISIPNLIDTLFPSANFMPPMVSITSPAGGSTFTTGTTVNVVATASDADGTVTEVEFFVNNSSIGTDSAAPYSANWNTVTGSASLTAIATDNDGAQTTSSPVSITVQDSTVGLEAVGVPGSFNVYPNPVTNSITLKIMPSRQISNRSYKVCGTDGKVFIQKELSSAAGRLEETIDISSLARGQYFIEVTMDGVASIKKIIKN